MIEIRSVRNGAQTGENVRKNSLFNYQLLYQLSYAGAAHMKAGLASSSRVRPTIALHHE
jgi:hypothetical protein